MTRLACETPLICDCPHAVTMQVCAYNCAKRFPFSVFNSVTASPINPADINVIQGTYGFKPALPANAGLEGVGEIVDIGSGVQKLKKGDWVLAPGDAWGTWRQFGVANENELGNISYSYAYYIAMRSVCAV